MNRADELLAELRRQVAECRDLEEPGFYHAIDNGAWLAAAFNELDELMTSGKQAPQDWQAQA